MGQVRDQFKAGGNSTIHDQVRETLQLSHNGGRTKYTGEKAESADTLKTFFTQQDISRNPTAGCLLTWAMW